MHSYKLTFESATGETTASPASLNVTHDALHTETIVYLPIGPTGTTKRTIYRTVADGSTYYKVASVPDNLTASYLDLIADATISGAAEPPTVNTANNSRVQTGVLTTSYGVMVNKAAEIQVDLANLVGASLDDLSVQIDYAPSAV